MTTQYTPNFGLALPDFRQGPWHDLLNGDMYWVQLLAGFAPRGEWANNTNYYPYDLAYSTSLGIFAICQVRHVSNPSGTIKNDSAYWAFLVDLSSFVTANAAAIFYTNTTSGLTATNVQAALDQIDAINDTQAGQITSLNTVNVTQGTDIGNRVAYTSETRTAPEKAIAIANIGAMQLIGNQTTTGGFAITTYSAGTFSSGTFTPNPMNGNYQYITNNGAFTLASPSPDCAIDIMVINGASAGAITFSGFSVNAGNFGDPLTTTNAARFIISIRRMVSFSTYTIKAIT
jgi:hypothetical protein